MRPHLQQAWARLVFSFLVAMPAGQTLAQGETKQSVATEAEAVLEAFTRALSQGDGKRALELLSDDAIILEGGIAQTRSEYADHHLGSDIVFLADLEQDRLSRHILHPGEAVVIITRTQLSGQHDGNKIDMVSAETAVLARENGQWKVSHLHWSN